MAQLFAPLTDGSRHPRHWPAALLACSQTQARRHGAAWDPSHIISIYGPESRYLGLSDFDPARHLHARFADTLDPRQAGAPNLSHIEDIFAFIDALPREARLLVHCLDGTTRGAAVTLGILARYLPADKAGQTVSRLLANAAPNPLLVALFDRALGLEGKLIKAGRKFPRAGLRPVLA